MNGIAIVVGNGESRPRTLPDSIREVAWIVVCNEAYEDIPDFDLIASIDGPATQKIKERELFRGQAHAFKVKNDWHWTQNGADRKMGKLKGSYNSGQLALMATRELLWPDKIYLLGMDLGGGRLYDKRQYKGPTNKCWDTWEELIGDDCIVVDDSPSQFKLKRITYEDFSKDLDLLRERRVSPRF